VPGGKSRKNAVPSLLSAIGAPLAKSMGLAPSVFPCGGSACRRTQTRAIPGPSGGAWLDEPAGAPGLGAQPAIISRPSIETHVGAGAQFLCSMVLPHR